MAWSFRSKGKNSDSNYGLNLKCPPALGLGFECSVPSFWGGASWSEVGDSGWAPEGYTWPWFFLDSLLLLCCQVSNTLPYTPITMNSNRLSPLVNSSRLKVWAQTNLSSLVSVGGNTLCTGGWTYDPPVSTSWEMGTRWTLHPTRLILIGPQGCVKPSKLLFTILDYVLIFFFFLKDACLPSWVLLTISLKIPFCWITCLEISSILSSFITT